MAAVTIRNLYEEAHRALNGAAQSQRGGGNARHSGSGRARPVGRLQLGTALSEISRKIGLTNADIEALEHGRDARPAERIRFE
jgi:antitoxin FitA